MDGQTPPPSPLEAANCLLGLPRLRGPPFATQMYLSPRTDEGSDEKDTVAEEEASSVGTFPVEDSEKLLRPPTRVARQRRVVLSDTEEEQEPTSSASGKQARRFSRWCVTWQLDADSYTECYWLVRDHCEALVHNGEVSYVVGGLEKAPTTGQMHVQGYVELPHRKQKRLVSLKEVLKNIGSPAPHLEPAKAGGIKNREYCVKAGEFFEYGTMRFPNAMEERRAARDDVARKNKEAWSDTVHKAKRAKFEEISPQHLVQYFGNIQKINFSQVYEYEEAMPKAYWIYGKPGVGKSRLARLIASTFGGTYLKDAMNKWWCNYRQEEAVIFDDVEKTAAYQAHLLKMVADRYPFAIEVKGATSVARPKCVIITSNYQIKEIWPEDEMVRDALKRRFVEINLGNFDLAAGCWRECVMMEGGAAYEIFDQLAQVLE